MKSKFPELLVIVPSLLFIVGSMVAVYLFVPFYLSDGCANEVLSRATSPDGKRVAVVFERDCGATTDFSTQVSILPLNKTFGKSEPGNTFICDSDHGQAPVGPGGGPELNVQWVGEHDLKITCHRRARVFRKEEWFDGVSITYSVWP